KLRPIIIALEQGKFAREGTCSLRGTEAHHDGESDMARHEIVEVESATLDHANAAGDTFFELGMMYSTGRSGATDLVSAHKWFNIAAMRGNKEAIRLRLEIAAEMSEWEI